MCKLCEWAMFSNMPWWCSATSTCLVTMYESNLNNERSWKQTLIIWMSYSFPTPSPNPFLRCWCTWNTALQVHVFGGDANHGSVLCMHITLNVGFNVKITDTRHLYYISSSSILLPLTFQTECLGWRLAQGRWFLWLKSLKGKSELWPRLSPPWESVNMAGFSGPMWSPIKTTLMQEEKEAEYESKQLLHAPLRA